MKKNQPLYNRRRVATALRSGKFPRTMQRLCNIREDQVVGYCCMGVAAVLLADSFPDTFNLELPPTIEESPAGDGTFRLTKTPSRANHGTLPEEGTELLFGADIAFSRKAQGAFIGMNDSEVSWELIAQALELPKDELQAFVSIFLESTDPVSDECVSAQLSQVRGTTAKASV